MNTKITTDKIIAGPCSAETEEQVMQTASAIAAISKKIYFRAGIWKPRTRPGSFEGIGSTGLKWLQNIKKEHGLKVGTEVAQAKHVEHALLMEMDYVWIGARTTVNPFQVQEIAEALSGSGIEVMIKNPIHPDIQLWLGAFERLQKKGIHNLSGIHRGYFDPDQKEFRNNPGWDFAIKFKSLMPDTALIFDPSHIAGKRHLVPSLCEQALHAGLDGFMIETHCEPEKAWSDADQQITPSQLQELLFNLSHLNHSNGLSADHELNLLRKRIDEEDAEIVKHLSRRMQIAEKIGELKKDHALPALQSKRWEELIQRLKSQALNAGLEEKFIEKIYHNIHEESVRKQVLKKQTHK